MLVLTKSLELFRFFTQPFKAEVNPHFWRSLHLLLSLSYSVLHNYNFLRDMKSIKAIRSPVPRASISPTRV